MGIIAACDIVVANEKAEFGLPELLYGFVPGIILPYLLERLSKQAIRCIAFSGTTLNAVAAKDIGLVDEIFTGEAEQVIKRWSRTLNRADREAVKVLRSLLDVSSTPADKNWLEACRSRSLELQMDIERRQALKLFLEEGVSPWEDRR